MTGFRFPTFGSRSVLGGGRDAAAFGIFRRRTPPAPTAPPAGWGVIDLPLRGPLFEAAIRVYRDAFSMPPYNERERAGEVRRRVSETHARYPGFRVKAAVGDGEVLGFAYAYDGEPGQWWHDAVAAALGPGLYAEWLRDSTEVVEVAVDPRYQGHGIGAALVTSLFEGSVRRTCVLSTRADSRAHHLYTRLGFERVKEMRFFAGGHVFYIMGKQLQD